MKINSFSLFQISLSFLQPTLTYWFVEEILERKEIRERKYTFLMFGYEEKIEENKKMQWNLC